MSTSGSEVRYDDFFIQATEFLEGPLPYQRLLAESLDFPQLVDVTTGLGKTAAAILAWVWRRRFASGSIRSTTPRRLVYCLPMRVLVEQTYSEALKWLDRLGLLAGVANWTERGPDGLPTKNSRLSRSGDGKDRGYEPDPDATLRNGWASQNGNQAKHPIAVHLLLGREEKSDWCCGRNGTPF